MFGRGFGVGTGVVVVLVIGKVTDAATGPCGLMLNRWGPFRPQHGRRNVGVLIGESVAAQPRTSSPATG